jgi:hypothetical protein
MTVPLGHCIKHEEWDVFGTNFFMAFAAVIGAESAAHGAQPYISPTGPVFRHDLTGFETVVPGMVHFASR